MSTKHSWKKAPRGITRGEGSVSEGLDSADTGADEIGEASIDSETSHSMMSDAVSMDAHPPDETEPMPPEATVSVEEILKANSPRLQAVPAAPRYNGDVRIRPRKTLARFRVGKQWYSIREGHEVRVPANVARHLSERGYC